MRGIYVCFMGFGSGNCGWLRARLRNGKVSLVAGCRRIFKEDAEKDSDWRRMISARFFGRNVDDGGDELGLSVQLMGSRRKPLAFFLFAPTNLQILLAAASYLGHRGF
ncbi:unnamed protein product [Linum trigynum]|uniref:Uncharacterized protein n=1 Tax=Linum trigynum TaxID=586398 RepID=A0AAV2GRR9_9ROSI